MFISIMFSLKIKRQIKTFVQKRGKAQTFRSIQDRNRKEKGMNEYWKRFDVNPKQMTSTLQDVKLFWTQISNLLLIPYIVSTVCCLYIIISVILGFNPLIFMWYSQLMQSKKSRNGKKKFKSEGSEILQTWWNIVLWQ